MCIAFACALLFLAAPASALTREQLEYYSKNEIYFYNPEGTSVVSAERMANVNYANVIVWQPAEREVIEANKPIYMEIAKKAGINWQIIAVLHSMDQDLLGDENEVRAFATEIVQEIAETGIDVSTDDGVKQFFFVHNGASEEYIMKAVALGYTEEEAMRGEGSVYVMNRFDAARDPRSTDMNPNWAGYYLPNNTYSANATTAKFGAFVKYKALTASSYSTAGEHFNQIALTLTYDQGEKYEKGQTSPNPVYVEYMKAASTLDEYNGASCDRFVATVVKYAGYDLSFPNGSTTTQIYYLMSHSDKWTEVTADVNHDSSKLMPGDIMIVNGTYEKDLGDKDGPQHIKMVVQFEDGDIGIAHASLRTRTGQYSDKGATLYPGVFYETRNGHTLPYHIFRATGSYDDKR